MSETLYNWPVLLDPPGAVDAGNNSYRWNGITYPRNVRTTVAHYSTLPDDTRYGPGVAIYTDGTLRRPDLSIVEDWRFTGERVTIAPGVTTADVIRNADGTPFQWGRSAALAAAGVPVGVDTDFAKAGIDALTSPIPRNTGTPLQYGPYRGLFPVGTTLVDTGGIVRVTGFDEVAYIKAYSPIKFDASGMQISPATVDPAAYRSYAPDPISVAGAGVYFKAVEPDTLGSSPTLPGDTMNTDTAPLPVLPPGVYSTGGMPPITPLPAPSLVPNASAAGDAAITVAPVAAAPKWKSETITYLALGLVALFAFGTAKRGNR